MDFIKKYVASCLYSSNENNIVYRLVTLTNTNTGRGIFSHGCLSVVVRPSVRRELVSTL